MYNPNNIQDSKNIPYICSKLVNRLMYNGKKTLAEKAYPENIVAPIPRVANNKVAMLSPD